MKIIFLGTPTFAVPALKKLIECGFGVVAVVTQPDRELDKKGKLKPTPVAEYATNHNLLLFQFDNVNKHVDALKKFKPNYIVTAAFGQMLSEEFLNICPVLNVHGSLLPLYRGSSPIQAAILNGDKITGITIMKTVKAMDAGDIVSKKEIEIGCTDTYGTLHDKMAILGAELLVETLKKPKLEFKPQNELEVTHVKKISKLDGLIDFSESAELIERKVRAYNPWPSAYTYYGKNADNIKIHRAEVANLSVMPDITCKNAPFGTIIYANNQKGLIIKCGTGMLKVLNLQAPSKRALDTADFLRGYNLVEGSTFGK